MNNTVQPLQGQALSAYLARDTPENKGMKQMKTKVRRILRGICMRTLYTGSKFHCPCCMKDSSRFRRYGYIKRENAQCPFCGALERHRLVSLYLEKETHLFEGGFDGVMLHVAPEPVFEPKFRQVLGKQYLTADLFDPNVDVKMDVMNIEYPDRTFDVVYCSHVLEHVPDDKRAMREFKRVLKDDGFAILLVPITAKRTFEDPSIEDPKERLRLFGQEDHIRRYGPDYKERLEKAGFYVKQITPVDFLSREEIRNMAITGAAGDIYLCKNRTDE